MSYLRTVDFAAYAPDRYGAQFLYSGERGIVIASNVPAGAGAPPQHVHAVDQLYYVVSGVMHVQLGAAVHIARPGTLVFMPAGTPHHNWNEGDVDEFHFEVLAPIPPRGVPILTATDETDLGDHVPRVAALAADGFVSTRPGFQIQGLLRRAHGSEHMSLSVVDVDPGAGGPPTHVHDFDQFYFVLEGELTVQIGLDEATVGPHSLVVLPAGVPHSHRNAGPAPSRHISTIAPEPLPGQGPWDRLVTLTPG